MRRSCFNSGWEFSRDDGPFEPVIVPHDAMLGNKRSKDAPAQSNSGYYHGASYRYRKVFELDARQAQGALALEFEGIYRDARIQVNGIEVDAPPYGFIPFFIDLEGIARKGTNTIEVACANEEQPDCRWYSGAGLFRPIWLWEGPYEHIEPEGIRITTLSINPTSIRVDVACKGGTPHIQIISPKGVPVAAGMGNSVELEIPDVKLWSAEAPALYRCVVELREAKDPSSALLDAAETSFGIRLLSWSPNGFFVNGNKTLLQGGCIHCDNGILGAASFPESEYRRIRLLKKAGFNAVRIAHNPAPAALLDACDEVGMYVIDEAWDMWFSRKSIGDYSHHFLDWLDYDLTRMASRDYNHPSVIAYSIGNEVADPLLPEGIAIEESMVSLLHSLDETRPVTCGLNLAMLVMERFGSSWYEEGTGVSESAAETDAPKSSLMFNLTAQAMGRGMTLLANVPGADKLVSPGLDALDIAGYNYASARYAIDARKHPDRIIVGSETFPFELPSNWRKCEKIPNLIGDFMWAAWDYLGEAGAGAWAYSAEEAGFSKPWPWLIAGSGALDILGNPNAAAALAGAVWDALDGPSIQVRPVNRMAGRTYKATWRGTDAIPSWSWRGCAGTDTEVEVYDAHAHTIELRRNGGLIGKKRVRGYVARFSLTYEPGILEAISFDERGLEVGRSSLQSARGELKISAKVEGGQKIIAGGIAYVSIDICDKTGCVESNADERICVEVEGGVLLAFGSANPAPTESFLKGAYTTYRGRALAIVYRTEPGVATLTACGETLSPGTVNIDFSK